MSKDNFDHHQQICRWCWLIWRALGRTGPIKPCNHESIRCFSWNTKTDSLEPFKICPSCEENYPFFEYPATAGGIPTPWSICLWCRTTPEQRQRYQDRVIRQIRAIEVLESGDFKPYPGDDLIVVSNHGEIVRLPYENDHCALPPIVLRQSKCPNGYGSTGLPTGNVLSHIVIAAAWHGPCPSGFEVDHLSTRLSNSPEQLEYVTHKENQLRAKQRGANRQDNSRKMTDQDVLEFRRRHAAGETQVALAKEYDISLPTAWKIANNKTHREVDDTDDIDPNASLPIDFNAPSGIIL